MGLHLHGKQKRKRRTGKEALKDCLRSFYYTIESEAELQAIIQNISTNTSYISPGIQNEVISILISMVLEQIVSFYGASELNFSSMKADEARDTCGVENLSVV